MTPQACPDLSRLVLSEVEGAQPRERSRRAEVCVLTSGHSALDDRVFYKECRSLRRAGYGVTLVAPLNDDGFLFDMAGKSLPYREAVVDGVKIRGFARKRPSPGTSDLVSLARLAGAVRFAPDPYAHLVDMGLKLDADIYHCHELWSLMAGIEIKRALAKRGRRPKLVYDVHEYHPASEIPPPTSPGNKLYGALLRKAIIHFERQALKHVDYVITANQITRGYLLTLNRFIQTEVIYNCSILSGKERGPAQARRNRVVVCHEGSLKFNRGLRLMLEVMQLLQKSHGDRVELLIVGDVYREERRYLEEKLGISSRHDLIRRTGWLPYEAVADAVAQADIGIILSEPTENNMLAGPPNKLFNYMGSGIPVVSVDLPETTCIITENQCGVVVKERNAGAVASALAALVDDEGKRRELGENALRAAHNRYSWQKMEDRLLKAYAELA